MLQRSSKQNLGFSDGTSQPWAGLKAIPVVHQHSGQLRDVVICYSFLVASKSNLQKLSIFLGILSQSRQNSFTFMSGTDSASCGAWVFAWHFSRHLSFADKWLLFRQSSACFPSSFSSRPIFLVASALPGLPNNKGHSIECLAENRSQSEQRSPCHNLSSG